MQAAPEFPIEAYAVPLSKKNSRTALLTRAAEDTVATYREIAAAAGLPKGPALISGTVEKMVGNYFSSVARFKQKHGFKPGERINQSKIAALTLDLLAHSDPTDFFVVPTDWSGTDDEMLLHFDLIFNCLRAILFIREIPPPAREELLICVRNIEDTSVEWLIVTMRFLCTAHGKSDETLGD